MFEKTKRFVAQVHWPILLVMIMLMAIGVSAICVSERAEGEASSFSTKQTVFACLGVVVFLFISSVPHQRVGRFSYAIFAGTLVLLVVVLFLPPIRHARRWINLRIMLLQPSEIAKITYVIALAWYLQYGDNYRRLRGLVIPFAATLAPMALILVEPDLGTCLLFLPTLYMMLFAAGARVKHLLGIVVVTAALLLMPLPREITDRMGPVELRDRKAMAYGGPQRPWVFSSGGHSYVVSPALLWPMAPHQLRRIEGWIRQGDKEMRKGVGYQLYRSKTILGTGKWTGRADWSDTEAYFNLLPDDHTDFIFSIIGGQWGFLGCVAVLTLYAVVFALGIRIAVVTDDAFGRLLAVGVTALLFSQVCINVGMTMGLMPITGMTLPLVSYGGSSLVVNCAALGLLAAVSRHRTIAMGRKPFEHGERKDKSPAWSADR
ncbi:MAG: rod shape-determining protein RodA [Planctomycetes bacterium]|nr:rod shape-determining protein RodA [Planctomycetota bacterium]